MYTVYVCMLLRNKDLIFIPVFSSGNYRREYLKTAQCTHEFFDPDNPEGIAVRE